MRTSNYAAQTVTVLGIRQDRDAVTVCNGLHAPAATHFLWFAGSMPERCHRALKRRGATLASHAARIAERIRSAMSRSPMCRLPVRHMSPAFIDG